MRAWFVATTVVSLLSLGCPAPVKQPEVAPKISSFSVSSSHAAPGETVTLSWKVSSATSVRIEDSRQGAISGVDASSLEGSVSVSAVEDTLFVLTAQNADGLREAAAVALFVDEGASRVTFVASPSQVRAGEKVLLAWAADGARTVSLQVKGGAAIDVGAQKEQGSVEVTPAAPATYVLTVDGRAYEAQVDVSPSIDSFVATPASATPDQLLSLSWRTSGATKVALLEATRGLLTEETDPAKVRDGTFEDLMPADLAPSAVLTYELRVEGAGQRVTSAFLEVYVGGAPAVKSWVVPEYARAGGTFTASWTTAGANAVEILADGAVVFRSPSGAAASGSAELATPAQPATYELRALGLRGGDFISEARVVSPVSAPTLNAFTASSNLVANGGDPVNLTWNVDEARRIRILANDQHVVAEVFGIAAETGTISAYPNGATEYRLIADNGAGQSVTATVSVSVTTPATLTFNPATAPSGTVVSLTGTTVAGGGDLFPLGFPLKNATGDSFIDIATTGTELPFPTGVDTYAQLVMLPEELTVKVDGASIGGSVVNVAVDGWMAFTDVLTAGPSRPPDSFPTSKLMPYALAPYFEDLFFDAQSRILYRFDGTGATARLIVQWNNLRLFQTGAARVTFQAQLYAGGQVVFAYKSVSGVTSADVPVIGIVNADETAAWTIPAAQLTTGQPVSGDTFRLFGKVPLPYAFTANATDVLRFRQSVGTGFILFEQSFPVSGQP